MSPRSWVALELVLGALVLALALLLRPADAPAPAAREGGGTRSGLEWPREAEGGPLAYRRRAALVVGINRYAPPWPNLKGPVADAAEVADVLASRFGFDPVLLLVDEAPQVPPQPGVRQAVRRVTRDQLLAYLRSLRAPGDERGDAFVFYFAGHGARARAGRKGYLVLAGGGPGPLLDFDALARELRALDAHQTLLLLDSCYSGLALDPADGIERAVGVLERRYLGAAPGDTISRALNRRAFQVLTAGTDLEEVDDQVRLSGDYMRARDRQQYRGHSPFTAALLQALRGRAGQPDGTLLGSELGYYVTNAFFGERDARQTPRYASLGHGEGDLVLRPVRPVLDPRLVAPLYLSAAEYAPLRSAACQALDRLLGPGFPHQRDLLRSAVPHVTYLLSDPSRECRAVAARALSGWAQGRPEDVPEFTQALEPLRQRLADGGEADATRRQCAEALVRLAAFAGERPEVVEALERFVAEAEAPLPGYRAEVAGYLGVDRAKLPLPHALARALRDVALPGQAPKTGAERVRACGPRLVRAELLSRDSLMRYLRQHRDRVALLVQAKAYRRDKDGMAAKLAAGIATNFAGVGHEPGEWLGGKAGPSPSLWPGTREWDEAQQILAGPPHHHLWGLIRLDLRGPAPTAVQVSPDGRRLAVACQRGPVRVWDLAGEGEAVALPGGAEQGPGPLAFSPAGASLAAAGRDAKVRLWRVADASPAGAYDAGNGLADLAFAPDGDELVGIDAFEGRLLRLSCAGGKLTKKGEGKKTSIQHPRIVPWPVPGTVACLNKFWKKVQFLSRDGKADRERKLTDSRPGDFFDPRVGSFSPTGRLTALADRKTARVWNTETGQEVGGPRQHDADIACVAISPDQRSLACGGKDGKIHVWDLANGPKAAVLSGHTAAVQCLTFSPDGRVLVSGAEDCTVRLWSVAGEWARLPGPKGFVVDAAFGRDGRVYTTHIDGRISVFDLATGLPGGRWYGHRLDGLEAGVSPERGGEQELPTFIGLALAPDGRRLASVSKVVRVWDVGAGRPALRHVGPLPAGNLGYTPEGRLVSVISDSNRTVIRLGEEGPDGVRSRQRYPALPGSDGRGPAISPDGRLVVWASNNGRVHVCDTATGKPRFFPTGGGFIHAFAFGTEGHRLAVVEGEAVRVRDLDSRGERGLADDGLRDVLRIALSPRGTEVAAVTKQGDSTTVRVWDLAAGRLAWVSPEEALQGALAFAPEGGLLLTAGQGGEAVLWPAAPAPVKWTPFLPLCTVEGSEIRWRSPDWRPGSGRLELYAAPPADSLVASYREEKAAGEKGRYRFGLLVRAGNLRGAALALRDLPPGERAELEGVLASAYRLAAAEAMDAGALDHAAHWLGEAQRLRKTGEGAYLAARLALRRAEARGEKAGGAGASHAQVEKLLAEAVREGFDDWERLEADAAFAAVRAGPWYRPLADGLTPADEWVRRAVRVTRSGPREALALYDKALRKAPDHRLALVGRSYAYAELGRYPEALAAAARVRELAPRSPLADITEARLLCLWAAARPGTEEGRAARERDLAEALAALERAAGKGWEEWRLLKAHEDLKPLGKHPRFLKLVEP